MLPEVLSNGLCSLRPKEDKFTFSAVFTLDKEGTILDEWYGRTVINSNYRFSYEEIQNLLDNNNTRVDSNVSLTGKTYNLPETFVHAITTLNHQAKKLRSQRMKKGAISFDRVEVNFNLDNKINQSPFILKLQKTLTN